jgi:hypothetical protein
MTISECRSFRRVLATAATLSLIVLSGCANYHTHLAANGYNADRADVYDPVPRVNFGWRYSEGWGGT